MFATKKKREKLYYQKAIIKPVKYNAFDYIFGLRVQLYFYGTGTLTSVSYFKARLCCVGMVCICVYMYVDDGIRPC